MYIPFINFEISDSFCVVSFRAKLERLDQLGTEVILGHQDLLESKVCLEQQAKKVPK